MSPMTIMMGPERRRRWSDYDRHRILAAAFSPGAVVVDVARQNDVATSMIYKWRDEARKRQAAPAGFAPVVLSGLPTSAAARAGSITVELSCGVRVDIGADASAALVTATLRALVG